MNKHIEQKVLHFYLFIFSFLDNNDEETEST